MHRTMSDPHAPLEVEAPRLLSPGAAERSFVVGSATVLNRETLEHNSDTDQLVLRRAHWRDESGHARQTDYVSRTVPKGMVPCKPDAVYVVPILTLPARGEEKLERSVIVCMQFEASINRYVCDFPSGPYLNLAESSDACARRELDEQTGYNLTFYDIDTIEVGPLIASNPRVTSTLLQRIVLDITPKSSNNNEAPPYHSVSHKYRHITVGVIPLSVCKATLAALHEEQGYVIGAGLWDFSRGLLTQLDD
ncbi:uncharacterized protein L969DRAFT_45599 [Mixia osmundae IAM 14324]|uniref:Nudix hydrolase domain-containing protein n=1 Tax=Mixia osmundae (strain CBS 9802 / IAM 14324 / JCM 22182 / KY 12970) TaxID=764103 RepID=G7DYP0_MIXOS|nr:uncharacterized protein L969DRAFT_45599 [Mixia osmundae IAM 14324]KEI41599.1 hypothetical protein L969DRAFT_45599 [Mixia osmundae IAM 14324]GAA95700.1 hypothetical protein E5Q_02357 [Mixia osmundae IAM 14324]